MSSQHTRAVVAGAVLLAVAAGCMLNGGLELDEQPLASQPPTAGQQSPAAVDEQQFSRLGRLRVQIRPAEASRLLRQLPTVDDTPADAYDRDAYGEAWADVDHNGCNQRDDVLMRDVVEGTVTVGSQDGCDHDVLAGAWRDPYTGKLLRFDDLKDLVQAQSITIDHLVPLAEAHRSGADTWDSERRMLFANDLANLLAVDGGANSSKGDQDPANWEPPAVVWCDYALVWVQVKSEWDLGVDSVERAVLQRRLSSCQR